MATKRRKEARMQSFIRKGRHVSIIERDVHAKSEMIARLQAERDMEAGTGQILAKLNSKLTDDLAHLRDQLKEKDAELLRRSGLEDAASWVIKDLRRELERANAHVAELLKEDINAKSLRKAIVRLKEELNATRAERDKLLRGELKKRGLG